jgi:putative transposase
MRWCTEKECRQSKRRTAQLPKQRGCRTPRLPNTAAAKHRDCQTPRLPNTATAKHRALVTLIDGLSGFPDAIHAVCPQAQIRHDVVHLGGAVSAMCRIVTGSDGRGTRQRRPGPDRGRCARRTRPSNTARRARGIRRSRRSGIGTGVTCARLRISPRDSPAAVHHEHDREPIRSAPEDHEDARHFPNDEAAANLLYLAIRNIIAKWRRPRLPWAAAPTHFAQLVGDRFTSEA